MSPSHSRQGTSPSVRVAILLVSLIVAGVISFFTTGSLLPQDPRSSLIFQNSLLLIVLGSSLLEAHYTKPADSLVNSLTGAVTLVGVRNVAPSLAWWGVFSYCLLVFGLSTACVYTSSHQGITGWRKKIAAATYRPAVALGASRLVFSAIFLFGLFAFYNVASPQTVVYVIFWALFIVIWPLGVPEWISGLGRHEGACQPVGHIARTDWPGLVRVKIEADTVWDCSSPKVVAQADGHQRILAPLYTAPHGEDLIGTGLCIDDGQIRFPGLEVGCVYDTPSMKSLCERDLAKALGGEESSRLIGFVVEDSQIASIRFETWSDAARQGLLIWCPIGSERVYYQITDGVTHEEAYQSDRQGRQVAEASQVGVLNNNVGFAKHPWLPRMNTPVFADANFGQDAVLMRKGDFAYGTIPGTNLQIGGPFAENTPFHTAILGVTGAGKTELALDMVRDAVGHGMKVICIDLTAKYEGRLADLSPADMSVSKKDAATLDGLLFAVDTGEYRASKEKRDLKEYIDGLRGSIESTLTGFLEGDCKIGIITLHEIANTDVTIRITEMYLTCLLNYARDCQTTFPQTLVVVEEAHTVMPEPNTAGVSYEMRTLVNRISQIALQGRKYRIGLLVIAQRTATVSKSVLTQCNTVISFACFDNTSLEFLNSVFGADYAGVLPSLGERQIVAYGKGVRSQRPLLVEIPFDEAKANPQPVATRAATTSESNPPTIDEEEIPF